MKTAYTFKAKRNDEDTDEEEEDEDAQNHENSDEEEDLDRDDLLECSVDMDAVISGEYRYIRKE